MVKCVKNHYILGKKPMGVCMIFCAKKATADFIRHNPGADSAVTFWLKIPKAGHEYQQAHRHVRDPIGNLS